MKLCVDCKWYQEGFTQGNGYCMRPTGIVNPVTGGGTLHTFKMANTHRSILWLFAFVWGACGRSGRYWEAK